MPACLVSAKFLYLYTVQDLTHENILATVVLGFLYQLTIKTIPY